MTDILLAIAGVIGLILGAIGGNVLGKAKGRREGRDEATSDMKEADNARAENIRDRVERDLPERLRDMDGRGFRD